MSTPGYGDSGDSAGCISSCTRGFGNVFSFAFGLHPVPVRDAAFTDAAPTDAASACVIETEGGSPNGISFRLHREDYGGSGFELGSAVSDAVLAQATSGFADLLRPKSLAVPRKPALYYASKVSMQHASAAADSRKRLLCDAGLLDDNGDFVSCRADGTCKRECIEAFYNQRGNQERCLMIASSSRRLHAKIEHYKGGNDDKACRSAFMRRMSSQ